MSDNSVGAGRSKLRYLWYLVLLIPFVAMLWVSSYNVAEPNVLGFPFFYWYQFLWVIISAVLTAIVYFIVK